jgi:hypothetical protein
MTPPKRPDRRNQERWIPMDTPADPTAIDTASGPLPGRSTERLRVEFAKTRERDAARAVAALAGKLSRPVPSLLLLFASPDSDLDSLGEAIADRFPCPVLACTTAGEITAEEGYATGEIVAAAVWSPELTVRTVFVDSLADFAADPDPRALRGLSPVDAQHAFALLVVDGLSKREEIVVEKIHARLPGVPLVGGSAGDGLDFRRTAVYHQGRFHEDAAVLLLCETTLPFQTFRIQHFEPTEEKLVVTEADGPTRRVFEIDGLPAAEEYARAIGLTIGELEPRVFAAHPVMLRVGGEYFVRSIQKANPDGSLTFFCAIENGVVLTVARPGNLAENLRGRLAKVEARVPHLGLVFGCDCILRRLEADRRGEDALVRGILEHYPFIGFCSYGEQFDGVHVNQTLTGLALGG